MVTKQTTDYSALDFTSGQIILINKPQFWSSYKVVHKVKKAIGVKKVGHSGTLDPLATGLLILCTGKKTKQISQFQNLDKTYTGIITLGKTSPSMDSETEITEHQVPANLTMDSMLKIAEDFTGEIEQIPPMYSALKVDGKKLYHLARKNKTIERKSRKVTVRNFIITRFESPDIYFEITCTAGTYIRVIANDFGEKLGCGALLSKLSRTRIGEFKLEDSVDVEGFLKLAAAKQINSETA